MIPEGLSKSKMLTNNKQEVQSTYSNANHVISWEKNRSSATIRFLKVVALFPHL
jgi:hypothetical protein